MMKSTEQKMALLTKTLTCIDQWRNGTMEEEHRTSLLAMIIKSQRISQKLTRSELADIADIAKHVITSLERAELGAEEIDDLWLAKISGALNIQPAWLLLVILRGLPKISDSGITKPTPKPAIASAKNSVERAKPRISRRLNHGFAH
jgi:transcriptional regulator with XRE-family HTH domain